MNLFGETLETLGTKVEHLEVLADGDEFEVDGDEEEEEAVVELASQQNDVIQPIAHDTMTRPRVTRRSAAVVLANHGNGPGKKKKMGC